MPATTTLLPPTAAAQTPNANANANEAYRYDIVCFDGWELYREARSLKSPGGQHVVLSNAEYRLLGTFLQTPGRLLSRDHLMEQARGRAMDASERSIDLLVSRLRHKLNRDAAHAPLIQTVRGAGYVLQVQSLHGRMV